MAKAKKSEPSKDEAPKKPVAAAKKAPAKKPASPGGTPLIDTSLAAQAAAQMLVAGIGKSASSASNAPQQESAMFKQMKAGLNKSHSTTMSNLLEKSQGPEPTKGHSIQKQVGQNQTYNADVTRSGVPRRTPG